MRPLHTWTGTRWIIWGGDNGTAQGLGDGAVYDPSDRQWTPMSVDGAPPQGSRQWSMHWVGSKAVVVIGMDDETRLVAYDPVDNRWEPAAACSPRGAIDVGAAAWTGDRLLIWGRTDDAADGLEAVVALYRPAGDWL